MSGAMRRIGEYLGLLEDTGQYDDFDDETTKHDVVDEQSARETRDRRPAPETIAMTVEPDTELKPSRAAFAGPNPHHFSIGHNMIFSAPQEHKCAAISA